MCERVAGLCGEAADYLPESAHAIDDIRKRLDEPLRVAVAGRVSTGKSTLVNALLGVPVCQTGDVETTQVVTWFSHGDVERVEIVLRDGGRRRASLTEEGRLPESYGVAPEQIARVHVRLPQADLLRALTLIDTPGTESALTNASAHTEQALFVRDSLEAVAEADALIFVLKGMETDVLAVEAFGELTAGIRSTLVNTVGVINARGDADPVDGDELHEHARVARRLMTVERIRRRLIQIVPVLGLLGETARCHVLSLAEVAALHEIVTSPDFENDIEFAPGFLDQANTRSEERHRLFALLGQAGLRESARAMAKEQRGRAELDEILYAASNVGALEHVIRSHFVPRADAIKADQALARLERVSYASSNISGGQRLRSGIETLTLDPDMHLLRKMWALAQYASGNVWLPSWVEEALGLSDAPGAALALIDPEVSGNMTAKINTVARWAGGAWLSTLQRDVAQIFVRSYLIEAGMLHA